MISKPTVREFYDRLVKTGAMQTSVLRHVQIVCEAIAIWRTTTSSTGGLRSTWHSLRLNPLEAVSITSPRWSGVADMAARTLEAATPGFSTYGHRRLAGGKRTVLRS